MKKKFNERTAQEKIEFIVIRILEIAALCVMAYVIYLRVKMGQHIPVPLVGGALFVVLGIIHINSTRKQFQKSENGKKTFNKIFVRSLILAPIIVIVFLAIVVTIMVKTG